MLLIAVVNKVYSRINLAIFHAGICRDIRAPLLRIFANKVVALARQFLKPLDHHLAVTAYEFHLEGHAGRDALIDHRLL